MINAYVYEVEDDDEPEELSEVDGITIEGEDIIIHHADGRLPVDAASIYGVMLRVS